MKETDKDHPTWAMDTEWGGRCVFPQKVGSLMASGYNKLGTEEAMQGLYIVLETYHCNTEDEITPPLKARDYKDPLVICIKK